MNELEHMSPVQMKLWLMKFDEEEDQKKQQRAFYQQAQSTILKQAKAADKATQKSYSARSSRKRPAAANEAQSQINEQEANEQQNQDDKQIGPYTPYGQGMYPGPVAASTTTSTSIPTERLQLADRLGIWRSWRLCYVAAALPLPACCRRLAESCAERLFVRLKI